MQKKLHIKVGDTVQVMSGESKGQGGKEKDELAGIEIPLKISGTMQKPKYALDTKALVEGQLKDKVESGKEKLKNKLLEKAYV